MIETPPQPGLLHKLRHLPYAWVVAAAFVLAVFMDILDVTIVNVSLFKISKDLNASLPSTTWMCLATHSAWPFGFRFRAGLAATSPKAVRASGRPNG